jgi:hypothetical protein
MGKITWKAELVPIPSEVMFAKKVSLYFGSNSGNRSISVGAHSTYRRLLDHMRNSFQFHVEGEVELRTHSVDFRRYSQRIRLLSPFRTSTDVPFLDLRFDETPFFAVRTKEIDGGMITEHTVRIQYALDFDPFHWSDVYLMDRPMQKVISYGRSTLSRLRGQQQPRQQSVDEEDDDGDNDNYGSGYIDDYGPPEVPSFFSAGTDDYDYGDDDYDPTISLFAGGGL